MIPTQAAVVGAGVVLVLIAAYVILLVTGGS
jgi:hypothetical protein